MMKPTTKALSALALLSLATIGFGLMMGSVSNADAAIIYQLRLPRVLAAFAIGGLLAMSGALLQVITRNPLAEPSILGVSGGASVGALIAIFMGAAGSIYVPLAAWVGALSILIILYLLLGSLSYQPTRLILAGVMLATACGAISSLLIVFADDVAMPGMIHWLMGDLDSVQSLEAVGSILGLWLATWIVVAKYAPHIHLMQFGFDKAKSLGVDVQRLQWLMVLLVALASAGAVSIAGAIGFIGLLVPHLIRMLITPKHGVNQIMILHMSALLGGIVLVIADAIARTVLAPAQLPVGVITVLLGVPAFLWLLAKMSTWGEARS